MISIPKLNEISILGFLDSLGYEPDNRTYEKFYYTIGTLSICVDSIYNRWRERCRQQWNSLYKLAVRLFDSLDREQIEELIIANAPILPKGIDGRRRSNAFLRNVDFSPLTDWKLIDFLVVKGIPAELSQKYLEQADLTIGKARHRCIAFKNRSGGYMLIAESLNKQYIKPNDVSVIHVHNNGSMCYVFLDYLDMLSFCTLMKKGNQDYVYETVDMIVINQADNLEKARALLMSYATPCICMPHTAQGKRLLAQIEELSANAVDCSHEYEGFRSIHDFLINKNTKN